MILNLVISLSLYIYFEIRVYKLRPGLLSLFQLVFLYFILAKAFNFQAGYGLFIYSYIFLLAILDLKHMSVPKLLSNGFLALSLLVLVYRADYSQVWLSLILITLMLIYKEKYFGLGDLKILLGLLNIYGFKNFLGILFISIICGGLLASMMLIKDPKNIKREIPFLPFVLAGYLIYFNI